jgi:uncharacterized protein YjcR
MLSDDTKNKYMPTPKRRKEGEVLKRHYSDSQKIEAVTTYLMLGSLPMVASMLKISINTLKLWKKSQWWKDIEMDLRTQEDLQLSKRLQKIVTKSLDVIEDRMESGDFVYDQKTGEMRRKPVSMRDATQTMLSLNERHDKLIERHIEGESVSTDKIEKTLANLAAEFERIAKQVTAKPAVEVTDVLFAEDQNNAKETT